MKKIINNAPPVVVSTIRTPLECALSIDSGGGALSQVYDVLNNTYEPVDRHDTPLVLSPIISLVNPDTQSNVPVSSLSSVSIKWFIGTSTTPVTSRTPTDEYYLQTDDGTATGTPNGNLVVRHNVSHADGQAVDILCEFSCVDSSRGEQYKANSAVMLTCVDKVQDTLSIQLSNPSKVTFNPILSNSSQRTFKAKIYNGGTQESVSNYKIFWYVDGVLANTKVCYVSGQNTDTLVLDAEYADNVVVMARFATDTTATSPDHPAKAECTLIWEWPRMKVIPYSMSGESIKLATDTKQFGTIIQAYGKDIPDSKRNRYCKVAWYTQPTNSTVKTSQGNGFTKTISGSAGSPSPLFRTDGAKVNVGTILYSVGAKSSVSGSGVETMLECTERPVVITTIRTPLTGSLSVSGGGGALTQVYDALYNSYEPVDRRDTPLVLTPVASITDPDTGQIVPLSNLSSVEFKWFVGTSTTPVTSRTPSDEYYLQTNDGTATGTLTGALVVRHNVGPNDNFAVPIMCELSCTDNSRSEVYKFNAAVFLTTEEKVQDTLDIQFGNPNTVTYDPIAENSSQKVFKAKVYNNGVLVPTTNLTFFWYIDNVLINPTEEFGYISGQGTDTLTLDAEYYDNVVIGVRIALHTNAASPNHPVKAECTLIWNWPRIQGIPYAMSGQGIKLATDDKRFGVIAQAYSKDIPAAKRARYLRFNFYTKPTDTNIKKDQGWGDEVVVKGTDLFKTDGTHVDVGVDLYTVGTLKPVVAYDSYQMVNGELVGVGEAKLVRDEATGKYVVCGD